MGGRISTDLIRGHTDTIILNILRHETVMAMRFINHYRFERSAMNSGSLYSAFRRLEQDDLITSYWGDETQRQAQVLRITKKVLRPTNRI